MNIIRFSKYLINVYICVLQQIFTSFEFLLKTKNKLKKKLILKLINIFKN